MRVGLISYGAESLAPQYLSSFLKKNGHRVRLFFDPCLFDDKLLLHYPKLNHAFSFHPWIFKEIAEFKPELIGIPLLSDTFPWARALARKIKALFPNTLIVVGGTHVTFVPERVFQEDCFDFLIRGEAEVSLSLLATALESRASLEGIGGLWYREGKEIKKNEIAPLIQEMEFFGNPDRTIYEPYVDTSRTLLAVSARGCVYSCTYCHHNALKKVYSKKGRYLRRLDPEIFVEYLYESYKRYRFKTIQMYDEIFTYDLQWLQEFVPLYKSKIDLPYICLGHPNYMSEDVIKLLKDSKCFGVQIGVQSLSAKTRAMFLDRTERDEKIYNMIQSMEKHRLKYQLDMIFGLPGDQEKDYLENIYFFSKCKSASKINTLILSLQPQTDMVDHALKAGIIQEKDKASIDSGEEGCRVGEDGSLRDKALVKRIRNYMLMYRIAVKSPRFVTLILMKTGLYRFLRFSEPVLGHLIRFWGADKRDMLYVHHYIRYIRVFFRKKLWDWFTRGSPGGKAQLPQKQVRPASHC